MADEVTCECGEPTELPTRQARPQDMVVIAAAESLHETNHRNAALLRSQKEA